METDGWPRWRNDRCRSKGIQGSSTDFLICAMAVRHDLLLFTDDRDFFSDKKVPPIRLYPKRELG